VGRCQSLVESNQRKAHVAIIKRALGPLASPSRTLHARLCRGSPLGYGSINSRGRGGDHRLGGKLCGTCVVKTRKTSKTAQFPDHRQREAGDGGWDGGWIIDPDKDPNKKYDVEITRKVTRSSSLGLRGLKFLTDHDLDARARRPEEVRDDVAAPPDRRRPWPAREQEREKTAANRPGPAAAQRRQAGKDRAERSKGKQKDCKMTSLRRDHLPAATE